MTASYCFGMGALMALNESKISQVSGSFPKPPKSPPTPAGLWFPGGEKQGRSPGTCWLPPHAPITRGLSRVGPGARGCSPNPS